MLFAILFVFFSTQALADSYFVKDPHLVGVKPDESSTIMELIRTSLESNHQEVTDNQKDAKYTLRTKILKLGKAYVLTLEKMANGKFEFSSQMKSEKFEELDNVVARLVHSVVMEVPVNQDVKVNDVTENEAISGTRRRDTVNRWYFGMGPALGSSLNTTRTLFNFGLGYFFEIDPEWALKIVFDSTGGDFSYLSLGASRYFSQGNSSPVVTAELGYGSAWIDNSNNILNPQSTSNFIAGAGVGYQFFRTSKVNLEILLHGAIMMGSNSLGTPAEYGLRVGIYW